MSPVEMLGGSEKIWVAFLEVRINKPMSMLYWGLYWGPAIQGNYHVGVGPLRTLCGGVRVPKFSWDHSVRMSWQRPAFLEQQCRP